MKKIVKNDKKKRVNFFFSEKNQVILKSLISNTNISKPTRWKASLKATNQSLSNKNKLKNRCFLTGRKNIINKSYKSSRLKFLSLVKSGFIPGFKKSVW